MHPKMNIISLKAYAGLWVLKLQRQLQDVSVALARSTLSTPTPALPTTFSRPPAALNTSLVTCTT